MEIYDHSVEQEQDRILGSVTRRLLAGGIDFILVCLFTMYPFSLFIDTVLYSFYWYVIPGLHETFLLAIGITWFLFIALYFIVSESSRFQGTVGKALFKLKITDKEGDRITLFQSIIRFLCKIVSIVPLMAGFFIAYFTKNNQTLHDYAASTYVQKV